MMRKDSSITKRQLRGFEVRQHHMMEIHAHFIESHAGEQFIEDTWNIISAVKRKSMILSCTATGQRDEQEGCFLPTRAATPHHRRTRTEPDPGKRRATRAQEERPQNCKADIHDTIHRNGTPKPRDSPPTRREMNYGQKPWIAINQFRQTTFRCGKLPQVFVRYRQPPNENLRHPKRP